MMSKWQTSDDFSELVYRDGDRPADAFSLTDADTTPTAFTFNDVTDADLSTSYESNTITVAGIDAAAPMTITGGEYQINGGSWASGATTVVDGDQVKVRGTSSDQGETAVDVVLTIGGVSDTFTITSADTGGGGGGDYVEPAVHFGGSTYLDYDAGLVAINRRYIGYSFWQRVTQDALDQGYQIIGPQSLPSPLGLTTPFVGVNLNSNSDGTRTNINFNNNLDAGQEVDTLTGTNVPDVWQNVRVDYDNVTGVAHIFYDAVDVTDTDDFSHYAGDRGATFPLNGLKIGIPDTVADGFPLVGDLAAMALFARDTPIDMSLSADGALFNSGGKPADPSGFPECLILHSGDKDGFLVNQGTGGQPTISGPALVDIAPEDGPSAWVIDPCPHR